MSCVIKCLASYYLMTSVSFTVVLCLTPLYMVCVSFFFFQAEDGIRDIGVTGVQTCALPIWVSPVMRSLRMRNAPEYWGFAISGGARLLSWVTRKKAYRPLPDRYTPDPPTRPVESGLPSASTAMFTTGPDARSASYGVTGLDGGDGPLVPTMLTAYTVKL